jgi:hypothetical protein
MGHRVPSFRAKLDDWDRTFARGCYAARRADAAAFTGGCVIENPISVAPPVIETGSLISRRGGGGRRS